MELHLPPQLNAWLRGSAVAAQRLAWLALGAKSGSGLARALAGVLATRMFGALIHEAIHRHQYKPLGCQPTGRSIAGSRCRCPLRCTPAGPLVSPPVQPQRPETGRSAGPRVSAAWQAALAHCFRLYPAEWLGNLLVWLAGALAEDKGWVGWASPTWIRRTVSRTAESNRNGAHCSGGTGSNSQMAARAAGESGIDCWASWSKHTMRPTLLAISSSLP